MRSSAPIGVTLSDVRMIMVIIRVLVVELLCQTMTGQILVLKCLLLGMRRCQRLCLVLSNIE
jgi:hypothetical protein